MESWLGDYMRFRQTAEGILLVDSRSILILLTYDVCTTAVPARMRWVDIPKFFVQFLRFGHENGSASE